MLKSPSAHPNDTDPAEVSQPAQDLESSPRKEKTGTLLGKLGNLVCSQLRYLMCWDSCLCYGFKKGDQSCRIQC